MSKKKKDIAVDSNMPSRVNPLFVEVSNKIKEILESSGVAIQPFIAYSEFGISAQIRLVEVPKNIENETNKGTSTGEVGADKEQTRTTSDK